MVKYVPDFFEYSTEQIAANKRQAMENPYKPSKLTEVGFALKRSGQISFAIACFGSVILIQAALHVRADRTNRIPVVTYAGPLDFAMPYLAYLGIAISLGSLGVCARQLSNDPTRYRLWGHLTMMISIANMLLTVLFCAAVYED